MREHERRWMFLLATLNAALPFALSLLYSPPRHLIKASMLSLLLIKLDP